MALEREQKTYEAKLAELVAHEGKFVLIHGDDVAGFFDTYEDALNSGYKTFGTKPFMVKRIQAAEQVQYFFRPITCPT